MKEQRENSHEFRIREENGKGKPGSLSELSARISGLLGRHTERYANNLGWVYMAFGGRFMQIRNVGTQEDSPRTDTNAASHRQEIRIPQAGDYIDLIIDSDPTGVITATAQHVPEVTFGANITSRSRTEIFDSLMDVKDMLDDGSPITADIALRVLQDRPCRVIEGEEAREYQQVIRRMIDSQGPSLLGNRNAEQKLLNFGIVNPEVNNGWSVSSLNVLLQAGDVGSSIRDVNGMGRSIITLIRFSSHTRSQIDGIPLSSDFLVCVTGVYRYGTNDLLTTQVRFLHNGLPIAAPPEDRIVILSAIEQQIASDKMVAIN